MPQVQHSPPRLEARELHDHRQDSWDIKLIDFGLAKNYKNTADILTTKAGTP